MNKPELFTFLIIVLLALISCGSDGNIESKTIETSPSTEQQQYKNKFTEVPLTLLPSINERNDDTFTTDDKYPYSISLDLDSFKDKVAVFGVAFELWLGPKGWKGNGKISPEGNIYVHLHPGTDSSTSSPKVGYTEISSCQSCVFEAAAPYFESARNEYKKRNDNKTGITLSGMTIEKLSPSLSLYKLPALKGMTTIGVVNYIAPDSVTDAFYTEARFTLPIDQEQLAEFFVKKFIEIRELH